MTKSFKEFMEDENNDHPLISSLEDTLGIDPEDLKNEPQIATFFKLSQGTNMGSYKIIKFKRNSQGKITHALVKPIEADKIYKDKDGSIKKIPKKEIDTSVKLVSIKDLDGLLGQDFAQSQQAM